MKLKDYINHLLEIKKKYGGELECIYSSDDEGNYFEPVYFTPTVGCFDVDGDGMFDTDATKEEVNCVCVN